jgi:hypothetical protein
VSEGCKRGMQGGGLQAAAAAAYFQVSLSPRIRKASWPCWQTGAGKDGTKKGNFAPSLCQWYIETGSWQTIRRRAGFWQNQRAEALVLGP